MEILVFKFERPICNKKGKKILTPPWDAALGKKIYLKKNL